MARKGSEPIPGQETPYVPGNKGKKNKSRKKHTGLIAFLIILLCVAERCTAQVFIQHIHEKAIVQFDEY